MSGIISGTTPDVVDGALDIADTAGLQPALDAKLDSTNDSVNTAIATNPGATKAALSIPLSSITVKGNASWTEAQQNSANPVYLLHELVVPAEFAREGQVIYMHGYLHVTQYGGTEHIEHPAIILNAASNTLGDPNVLGSSGAFSMLCITRYGQSNGFYDLEFTLTAANGGSADPPGLGITNGTEISGLVCSTDYGGIAFAGQMPMEDVGNQANAIESGEDGAINVYFAADTVSKPGYSNPEDWGDLSIRYKLTFDFLPVD